MKTMGSSKNRKGFTIIEMVIAMVIITVILLVVVPLGQAAMDNSRLSNAIASIKAIQTAAVEWENDNGGTYSGISFANLAAPTSGTAYLPAQFSATSTNAWNGDYVIAADSSNNEQLDITLTNVPSVVQSKLTAALTKIAVVAPSYTAATTSTPSSWKIVVE